MIKLKKFLDLSREEKLLFLRAALLLPVCQCCISILPFRHIISLFSLQQEKKIQLTACSEEQTNLLLRRTRRTIQALVRHYPFCHARCLAQALTARHLLRKNNIQAILFLGARLDKERTMTAHAWLCCGHLIVTGEYEAAYYKEVAAFR